MRRYRLSLKFEKAKDDLNRAREEKAPAWKIEDLEVSAKELAAAASEIVGKHEKAVEARLDNKAMVRRLQEKICATDAGSDVAQNSGSITTPR